MARSTLRISYIVSAVFLVGLFGGCSNDETPLVDENEGPATGMVTLAITPTECTPSHQVGASKIGGVSDGFESICGEEFEFRGFFDEIEEEGTEKVPLSADMTARVRWLRITGTRWEFDDESVEAVLSTVIAGQPMVISASFSEEGGRRSRLQRTVSLANTADSQVFAAKSDMEFPPEDLDFPEINDVFEFEGEFNYVVQNRQPAGIEIMRGQVTVRVDNLRSINTK
jgi:hypothetical protein